MMKLGTHLPDLKKIQKIYKSHDTPLESCWHQQILLYQEIQIYIVFWYIISNSFNFFWVLKDAFINMVTILMMSAKKTILGLHQIKVYWNESYDVIISVYDVINKNLSRGSNYIVDVVMWPKFGNSGTCMKEVIITSTLQEFDQKNHFFSGVVLFKV